MKMQWNILGLVLLLTTTFLSGCVPTWRKLHNGHVDEKISSYDVDIWFTSKELWEYQNAKDAKRKNRDIHTRYTTEGGKFTVRIVSGITPINTSDWRYEVWTSNQSLEKFGQVGFLMIYPKSSYDFEKGYTKTWAAVARKVVPLTTKYKKELTFKLFWGERLVIEKEFEMGLAKSSQ